MAIQSRTQKRVRAIRRASDGSAFEKCDQCGVSVAAALAGMHECEPKREPKRFRGSRTNISNHIANWNIDDQPRSAFHFFMWYNRERPEDRFTFDGDHYYNLNKVWFEMWKNMSRGGEATLYK